ncbi:MAG: polysaccharide biosynthesis/export family protein, partial [Pirellulaceae bacterium]
MISPSITKRIQWLVLTCVISVSATGCTSMLSPISGIPSHRVPKQILAKPRNNMVPIDISRLRQAPPRNYLLDAGDILGIYIEGVLGNFDQLPPVHFPEPNSDLQPALGFPVPVREDGTISLPLVPPIQVRGLTLNQTLELIRHNYTNLRVILQPGKDRIIVTLMRERTYRVVVMRQDGVNGNGAPAGLNSALSMSQASRGQVVNLSAYKNDVLHALAMTGGLPGNDVKNEIKILRGRLLDYRKRDAFIREFYQTNCDQGPCLCAPPLPEDPAIIRIPLRLPPGHVPQFRPEDIVLEEGDIILIENREREVFYTGGLLGSGEHQLPRDYDLDALTALSLVGPGIGGGQAGGQGGQSGGFGGQSGNAASMLGG